MPHEAQTYYEAWQAQNRKLLAEGWTLSTTYMLDGRTQHWAEKNDKRIRVDPPDTGN